MLFARCYFCCLNYLLYFSILPAWCITASLRPLRTSSLLIVFGLGKWAASHVLAKYSAYKLRHRLFRPGDFKQFRFSFLGRYVISIPSLVILGQKTEAHCNLKAALAILSAPKRLKKADFRFNHCVFYIFKSRLYNAGASYRKAITALACGSGLTASSALRRRLHGRVVSISWRSNVLLNSVIGCVICA